MQSLGADADEVEHEKYDGRYQGKYERPAGGSLQHDDCAKDAACYQEQHRPPRQKAQPANAPLHRPRVEFAVFLGYVVCHACAWRGVGVGGCFLC